jgi:hypothetical protein
MGVLKVKNNFLSKDIFNNIKKSLVSAFHTDLNFKCKTAIYYVNSNNGGTLFRIDEKEIEIKSEENKIVMFDS